MIHHRIHGPRHSHVESLEPRYLASAVHHAAAPVGHGLAAIYYANPDFTGASVSRTDATVNFNWAGAAPASGIAGNNFSARWTGSVTPGYSQTYTFTVTASDGVRLWVNNRLLIDDWNTHALAVPRSGTISLTAKFAAALRLEYFDAADPASVSLDWSSLSTPLAVIPSKQLLPAVDPLLAKIDSALGFARQQLTATLAATGGNTAAYPDYTNAAGAWVDSNVYNWTAGFFPGELWQMYRRTNDPAWQQSATTWTLPLGINATYFTDDLTFRIFNAYYPLYQATGNPAYKQIILDAAAKRASTYNATVGSFSSVGVASHSHNPLANFGVLMDHTMDLSMVFWAAKQTGNTVWYNEALQTARTVAKNFFRINGSVYQWGYFDKATGKFISGENYQGYSDSSAWSRAQAWAIHAFTDVYRWTGAADMLADARRVSNYFVGHLPADHVPYWDFNAPGFRTPSATAAPRRSRHPAYWN